MPRRLFLILFFLFLIPSFPSAGVCAPAPEAVREMQRRQEQVILQQEERLRRQQREFEDSGKALRPPTRVEPLPHMREEPSAPCMDVDRIEVSGATQVSAKLMAALTAPYTGKCLGIAEINNLLRDITNEYIERGYVTSRAFVAPSGQEPGLLRVLVVEGTVEKIIINDGDRNSYYRGRTAFPFLEGKPLNLRDIEQGLDQLNRLPSAEAASLSPEKAWAACTPTASF